MTQAPAYEFGVDYRFGDLFPDDTAIAGFKAVNYQMLHRYLCFGKSTVAMAAGLAPEKPWVMTIGTMGDDTVASKKGRMLNMVKLTNSRQPTGKFASSQAEKLRYEKWPEAVAVRDVFEFTDPPHVMSDLKPVAHPLVRARDVVVLLNETTKPMIKALGDYKIRLVDLPPFPSGCVLDKIIPGAVSVEEGRRYMKEIQFYERSSALSKAVKQANLKANGGVCVCEGCEFHHKDPGMFDAHHHRPVHLGVHTTTPSLMSVLCPTCHRIVHKAGPRLHLPIGVPELRKWHADRAAAAIPEAAD